MRTKIRARWIVTVGILAVLISGCGKRETSRPSSEIADEVKETAGRSVQKVQTVRMDIQKVQLFQAQIAPKVTELEFPEAGIFDTYEYALGDPVKKGEILARTDDEQNMSLIADAQEVLDEMDEEYERAAKRGQAMIDLYQQELRENTYSDIEQLQKEQQIEKQKLLMRQEKEQYTLRREHQESELVAAKSKEGTNVIAAPHDGTIVYLKSVKKGDYILDTEPCIGVTEESQFYMVCDFIGKPTIDRAVRIYGIVDGKEYDLTYQIPDSEMASELSASQLAQHTSFLIEHPDESIVFSGYAEVVVVREEADQVIAVPKLTVKSDTAGKYVYLDVNGTKEKTYIKTGLTDGIWIEVKEGLSEGDTVYVEN